MTKTKLIFCGSFVEYSALPLAALLASTSLEILAVVTTPPAPAGKHSELLKNPVHILAETAGIQVFTPETLSETVIAEIEKKVGQPEILLTAGYGKLLPVSWLKWPSLAALNLHFSLLPSYRGANPAEWALLLDEHLTGITLIEMSPSFDTGKMVASASASITNSDTRETVYDKLYHLGATTLGEMITTYVSFAKNAGSPPSNGVLTFYLPPLEQPVSKTPYAARFTRDQGYLAWPALVAAMEGKVADLAHFSPFLKKILTPGEISADAVFIERATRALAGFPSLWTIIGTAKGEKRMKILASHVEKSNSARLVLDQVHIEGKAPARWAEVKNILTL